MYTDRKTHMHTHAYTHIHTHVVIHLESKIEQLESSNYLSAKADLLERAPANLKRFVELDSVKGASSWLTVLPWQEHGFTLHKTVSMMLLLLDMVGALLDFLSTNPVVLGILLNIYFLIRHNEICNLTANLLTEVCHKVKVEPGLVIANFW